MRSEIGPGLFESVASLAQMLSARIRFQQLNSPAQRGRESQHSLAIKPSVIKIAGGHCWSDTLQALGLFGGGKKLRHSLIGKAVHADAAIRFVTSAKPIDSLRAITRFVAEWIKLATRISPAAHVLDDDVVSMAGKPNRMRKNNCRSDGAPIGLAHQQGRA